LQKRNRKIFNRNLKDDKFPYKFTLQEVSYSIFWTWKFHNPTCHLSPFPRKRGVKVWQESMRDSGHVRHISTKF